MTKKRSVTDLPTKVCALASRDGDQLIVTAAGSADFIAFCELVPGVHFAWENRHPDLLPRYHRNTAIAAHISSNLVVSE